MAAAAPAIRFTVADRVVYPEGTYTCQVTDYTPAEGKFGPQVRWTLELPEIEREDGRPARVSYFTSMSMSAKSKLGKLMMACGLEMPETQDEADEWSADLFLGKRCRVRLVHSMGTDGQVYCNVDDVLPLPKAPKAGGGVKVKKADPEPEEEASAAGTVDPFAEE